MKPFHCFLHHNKPCTCSITQTHVACVPQSAFIHHGRAVWLSRQPTSPSLCTGAVTNEITFEKGGATFQGDCVLFPRCFGPPISVFSFLFVPGFGPQCSTTHALLVLATACLLGDGCAVRCLIKRRNIGLQEKSLLNLPSLILPVLRQTAGMAAPPKANATPPQLQKQQQAAPKNTAAAGGKRQGPNSRTPYQEFFPV